MVCKRSHAVKWLLSSWYDIAKELIQSARNSNAAYKEVLKHKKESEKKAEKDQRLASIEEEITQLNFQIYKDLKRNHYWRKL